MVKIPNNLILVIYITSLPIANQKLIVAKADCSIVIYVIKITAPHLNISFKLILILQITDSDNKKNGSYSLPFCLLFRMVVYRFFSASSLCQRTFSPSFACSRNWLAASGY